MKKSLTICFVFCSSFLQSQTITTVVGTGIAGYSGDGGAASAAQLNMPHSIKFDNTGNAIIVDAGNHVLRKINSSGIITTIAGNGIEGYSGDGGSATNAKLSYPSDVAFDQFGNIYFSEYGNGVIRRITTDGVITTFAGTGTLGYSGDGGPATNAQLSDPIGLTFDEHGNLYFSHNGRNRIRRISNTGLITTVVGTGVPGFTGDGGPATSAQIRLTGYLAGTTSGELYIPDYVNHRIRRVNSSGIISTFAGTGAPGNTGDGGKADTAQIGNISVILIDQYNNKYISDGFNPTIRKIDSTDFISTIAGTGIPGYSGDGGLALTAQFDTEVNCSAIDTWGNLYVADPRNHRIRRINFNPITVTQAPTRQTVLNVYPNPATTELTIVADIVISSVTITNILGQEVLSQRPGRQEATINIEVLPSGVYSVQVNGTFAGRFVK